jgi:acyl-CoA synthetase (AMP-forming)/AMP-acid ligase II
MTTIPAHLAQFAADGSWTNMTIGDYARRWAESDPDKVVYLGDPAAPTYASLLADGEALARALRDLGLRTGDVIGFQVPNWVEASVINLAANLGGFVIAPIVPIYRDAEVIQMLGDCGAKPISWRKASAATTLPG